MSKTSAGRLGQWCRKINVTERAHKCPRMHTDKHRHASIHAYIHIRRDRDRHTDIENTDTHHTDTDRQTHTRTLARTHARTRANRLFWAERPVLFC